VKKYTSSAKNLDNPEKWYVVDANGAVLGRLASQVAHRLRGKHNPEFTPHVDTGDYIVVVNADKIRVTGNKFNDKMYYRHSGYPGGIRSFSASQMLQRKPDEVLRLAVKGMLPKTTLGRQMYRKLHVFAGDKHPHIAQQPKPLELA